MSGPQGTLDALIVGAGPTGLTLAAQMAAMGASVRIVDREVDRVHESRALAVQPRTLEVMRGLGLAHTLVDRGNDAVELCMHSDKRSLPIRLFDIGLHDTAYPFLLFISQAEIEAIMNEHLDARGVQVERQIELADFTTTDDGVSCTLKHEGGGSEEVHARYLAGCDGAHSTVRHIAGIPFEGGAYPQTFVLGDVEVTGDVRPDAVHAFPGPDGMMFLFPLGMPATWRVMGMRPSSWAKDVGGPEAEDLSLEELQAISDSYTGGALRLHDPAWLATFRLHHRQAARYRAGRVFLAGDAAHVHSPAGAQGMNTGVQDAWNLGWKLALVCGRVANESLLESYESERWPIGRFVLRFTDRIFSLATSDNRLARAMRARGVPMAASVLVRLNAPRAFGFRTISQLGIHYRSSPAVQEGRMLLRRGPKAGERLPDARIRRDGHPVWLQEALSPFHFTLLLCGPPTAWREQLPAAILERDAGVRVHYLSREPAAGVFHDAAGEALDRLGVKDAAHYLVRPDGHIGYRSGGTDLRDLEAYLARFLSPQEPRSP